jgi:hypothetical protein
MKLPGIRRDTAALLERANEDLAAVETGIVRLQAERAAKLLTISPAEVALLDARIADQERAATVFRDRAAGYEQRLDAERQERAEQRYREVVAKMPAAVRRRHQAALAVEQVLIDLARVCKRYVSTSVTKSWPDDTELPDRGVPRRELTGSGALDELIREIFGGDYRITDLLRRPVSNSEFAAHAIDHSSKATSRGFADNVQAAGEEWLHDLQHAHDPIPVETEEGEPADQVDDQTEEAIA